MASKREHFALMQEKGIIFDHARDFITKENDEITLIEVKATTGNTKSAKTILKKKDVYNAKKCIKLSENNIGITENMITIPYYLAFMLE